MDHLAPRLIRPVPDPPGSYFRPSRNDHKGLADFLTQGAPNGFEGVVFDAALDDFHKDLFDEVAERRIEAILDTRALELAMAGGLTSTTRKIAWSEDQPHAPQFFSSAKIIEFVQKIVAHIEKRKITAVLAPSHFIAEGVSDTWFPIDRELTHALRSHLDAAGLDRIPIYYPLATRTDIFFDEIQRGRIRDSLLTLPIDALWLRIHPFGSRSAGRAVRNFIRACACFHGSGLPLVAEHSGTVGLALLAFGAVGGIESGITIGEHFDINRLTKPRLSSKGYVADARVYIHELQSFILRKKARKFFENRTARAHFGCKLAECCRDGAYDMVAKPKGHFIRRRAAEVLRLGEIPESLRAGRYMEEMLRPATDRLLKAIPIEPSLEIARQRLESLRVVLGAVLDDGAPASFSAVPIGRRIQIRRGA